MTEIFRFLFFTKISSYFLEESDRNFGGVLIKGGFLFLIALYDFFLSSVVEALNALDPGVHYIMPNQSYHPDQGEIFRRVS